MRGKVTNFSPLTITMSYRRNTLGQVVNLDELLQLIQEHKRQGKKIVTTNGCFDIIHVGHVRYLKQARELGDILVVGLNTDESVRKLKGLTRPVNNENDRAEVMAALNPVDYVVLFNEETAVELLGKIKTDIYAKGGDYTLDTLPETEIVHSNGGKVAFIPFVEGKSTTNIIEKIKD
ncbi:MAG: Protein RfaE, protein [uncultured bacterium]|nr:MAG: Protein RfaE, protein [uncultured bacterium]